MIAAVTLAARIRAAVITTDRTPMACLYTSLVFCFAKPLNCAKQLRKLKTSQKNVQQNTWFPQKRMVGSDAHHLEKLVSELSKVPVYRHLCQLNGI